MRAREKWRVVVDFVNALTAIKATKNKTALIEIVKSIAQDPDSRNEIGNVAKNSKFIKAKLKRNNAAILLEELIKKV
jgi:hypothetical protein